MLNPIIQGSLLRATYGVLAAAAPRMLLKALFLDEAVLGEQGRYFNRLLGGREIIVATRSIAAVNAGEPEKAVKINLLCSATDTMALLHELKERGGMDATLMRGLGFNMLSWAITLRAMRETGAGPELEPAEAEV
jgi:hypothetical protein